MRKLFPLFIFIIFFVGVAYALVPGLFPDSPLFPRVPSGSGTLGSAIARIIGMADIENYAGTGLISNTNMLDGTTASGYLRGNTCIGTDKWIGIDASNRPICGTTSTLIADFGKIESQDCTTSTIYNSSGSTTSPTSTGFTLKSGDIIKTSPGCTMTIAFSDLSILRLDGDTVVSFDIGYLSGGTTIASALLQNGSLWGRILTETGSYTVGTNEIIAGVRGTSISLTSTGNTIGPITWSGTGWTISRTPGLYPTEVAIVDTTTNTGAVIACRKDNGGYRLLSNLKKTKSYLIPPGGCGNTVPSPLAKPKETIFIDSPWARKNTIKDLEYMYRKAALSGSVLHPAKLTILRNEIDTTQPEESATGAITLSGITEGASLCEGGKIYWNARYGCQEIGILAIADYSIPPIDVSIKPTNLDIRTSTGMIVGVPIVSATPMVMGIGGVNLTTLGQPELEYDRDTIQRFLVGNDLRGKTIEIRLAEPIATGIIQYFLDLDTLSKNYLKFVSGVNQYAYTQNSVVPRNKPYGIDYTIITDGTRFSRDTTMKIYTYRIDPGAVLGNIFIGTSKTGTFRIQKKIESIKILN